MLRDSETYLATQRHKHNSEIRFGLSLGIIGSLALNFVTTSQEAGHFVVPDKPGFYLFFGGVYAAAELVSGFQSRRIEAGIRAEVNDIGLQSQDNIVVDFNTLLQPAFEIVEQSSIQATDVR